MSETAITRSILKRLNAIDGVKAIKLPGGPMLERGTPDIHVTARGRSVWLEVKRPGETPSKIQEKRIKEWAEAGAEVAVVTSVEQAMEMVNG